MRWGIIYLVLTMCLSCQSFIDVISIIDSSSILSSHIKIFSTLKSCQRPRTLFFRFLVLDDLNLTRLESAYRGCFPDINVQFKKWERPVTLPPLLGQGFDAEYIYSRIYLPHIFHEVDRYVYLDNDVIVNVDITEVYFTPLVRAAHPLTTRHAKSAPARRVPTGRTRRPPYQAAATQSYPMPTHDVAMGFVFDVNEKLRGYVGNGFNHSSPLFRRAMGFIEPAKFFNGGVALVNAKKWRKEGLTSRAEEIMRANEREGLYSRRGLGDQGLFFLLMQEGLAELHPAFNMRRVPNKTTRYLKERLGIVHFAGTTHGNARTMCIDPLQYPVLSGGAVPLYLAIVKAFFGSCPVSLSDQEEEWESVRNTCARAINKTRAFELAGKLEVSYMSSSNLFKWPP